MSTKEAFTPEEWNRVVSAPMLVGMAITAADPGGLFSAFQESAAVAKAIATGAKAEGDTLVSELAKVYTNLENRTSIMETIRTAIGEARAPEAVVAACEAELGQVAGIVAAKAPAEAAGFGPWLLGIAQSVAEAGKEGGFLGFGGVAVSPAETATIERLRTVLTGTA